MENHWFWEFDRHLTSDEAPSRYFDALMDTGRFPGEYPFTMLSGLRDVAQSPAHHPEGNVWNHTMLVVDNAARMKPLSRQQRAFLWAALLHDIGKKATTRQRAGKITAYDHDKVGEKLAADFLRACRQNETLIGQVCPLVRWHMQPLFVVRRLPFADLKTMIRKADINEVALLTFCDRLGRGPMTEQQVKSEQRGILYFLEQCRREAQQTHAKSYVGKT